MRLHSAFYLQNSLRYYLLRLWKFWKICFSITNLLSDFLKIRFFDIAPLIGCILTSFEDRELRDDSFFQKLPLVYAWVYKLIPTKRRPMCISTKPHLHHCMKYEEKGIKIIHLIFAWCFSFWTVFHEIFYSISNFLILFFNNVGCFQKGISFSGSVLPPWTLSKRNTERSIHLAALLGCPTNTTRDAVTCLTKRPARQILQAAVTFQVK